MENSNRIRRKRPYFKEEKKIKRDGSLFENEEYALRHKKDNKKATKIKTDVPLSEMSELQIVAYCRLRSNTFQTVRVFSTGLSALKISGSLKRKVIKEYTYQLNARYDELNQEEERKKAAKRKRDFALRVSLVLYSALSVFSAFFYSGDSFFISLIIDNGIDYGIDLLVGAFLAYVFRMKYIYPIALKLDIVEDVSDEGKSPQLIKNETEATISVSVLRWFVFFLAGSFIRKYLLINGSVFFEENMFWINYVIDLFIGFVLFSLSKITYISKLIDYFKTN